jgi:protein TonB
MNDRLFITLPGSVAFWFLILFAISLYINNTVPGTGLPPENIAVKLVFSEGRAAQKALASPTSQYPDKSNREVHNPTRYSRRLDSPMLVPPQESTQENPVFQSAPSRGLPPTGNGRTPPTVLYQPLPTLPHGMESGSYILQVNVKIEVAKDGSATPEILTPIQKPELNQVVLETLKTWKFNPAMENGIPVDSIIHVWIFIANPVPGHPGSPLVWMKLL